jgi:hypothetical protein
MNKFIIIAGFVIVGSGVVNAWTNQKPVTAVILGGYIFVLLLALLDTFGGPVSNLANALALLAMTYVLLTEFPWATIIGIVQGGQQ